MKKKGEFKKFKLRMKARQDLYDSLKLAREEGESFCYYEGVKYKLNPWPENGEVEHLNQELCLVKSGRYILMSTFQTKDGYHFTVDKENITHRVYDLTKLLCFAFECE
jgi:hypothetical protein